MHRFHPGPFSRAHVGRSESDHVTSPFTLASTNRFFLLGHRSAKRQAAAVAAFRPAPSSQRCASDSEHGGASPFAALFCGQLATCFKSACTSDHGGFLIDVVTRSYRAGAAQSVPENTTTRVMDVVGEDQALQAVLGKFAFVASPPL
ncbi:hypothetical protein MRX96_049370 [Rhipicephalus microplus]